MSEKRESRPKTKCPHCGSRQSRIYDGRDIDAYGDGYWRRRRCVTCGKKYRTEEVVRGIYPKSPTTSSSL